MFFNQQIYAFQYSALLRFLGVRARLDIYDAFRASRLPPTDMVMESSGMEIVRLAVRL